MKTLLTSIIILFCAISFAFAQSQTTAFDVDGIKVIFKPTVKEIINVRMFYRGGVTNYNPSQAGIERFALSAATECGTKKYSGDTFKDRADKYGINIHGAAEYDYGDIEMESVSKYFNEGWDLFTEAVVNPIFDESQVQLLRNKIIASIRGAESDPDKRSEQLILNNAFENTPYATDPDGNTQAIEKLTAAGLNAYYNSIFNKNQMFIVVAGKISKEELVAKIHASFGAIPVKQYTKPEYHEPFWNDYKTLIEKRGLATNYINGIMNAPPVISADFIPYRMGIAALGGSLFGVLRTQLNLSYDPGTSTTTQQMPYALMSVTTNSAKEAVYAMTDLLGRVRRNGITAKGVETLKSSFITNYYIRQQSTSALTGSLGEYEVLGGWQLADAIPVLVNETTADQINYAMNKYIVGLRWSYLGNPDQANDTADAFGVHIK